MAKVVDIVIKAKDATVGAWKRAQAGARRLKKTLSGALGAAKRFGAGAAVAIGLVGAAAAAAAKQAVGAYRAQAEAEAKLESVIRATGFAAGKTASELKKQAAALQETTGVGDEVIISTQAMVATFKNIKGDEFDRTTKAVIDMAAAMKKTGKDTAQVEASSIRLSKALNDPIANLGELSRVGVQFTDTQKDQIRAFAESGDMAAAQGVILAELESQFGGTAEAMSEANKGMDDLKNTFGDTLEEIGRTIVETEGFEGVVARLTEGLKKLSSDGYIDLWAENVRGAIKSVMPLIDKVSKGFSFIKNKIQEGSAFLGALSAGSSVAEAKEFAKSVPQQMKDEQDARLKQIREEKAAKKAAKAEAERSEMEAAQVAVRAEQSARKKAAADKAAAKEAKEQAKADKEAAKAAAERVKVEAKLVDTKKKLADLDKKRIQEGFEKGAAQNDAKISELQTRLGGIAKNKEERRAQELEARGRDREDRREKELKARQARGVKLGADALQFLERRDLQDQIARQQEQKRINEENAKLLRETEAANARKEMVASLKRTEKMLTANLANA